MSPADISRLARPSPCSCSCLYSSAQDLSSNDIANLQVEYTLAFRYLCRCILTATNTACITCYRTLAGVTVGRNRSMMSDCHRAQRSGERTVLLCGAFENCPNACRKRSVTILFKPARRDATLSASVDLLTRVAAKWHRKLFFLR